MSGISVCGRNPITLQFKWKLLFCGAANYPPVVLFIVLYKVVVTFQCVNEILWCYHSNESYSKQYFPVVLFILLYKVVLTFDTVEEILWCDHSNESYWAVLSSGTVYYAVQGDSNFLVCGWKPVVWPFKHKLLSRVPSIVSFFLQNEILFFFSCVYNIILH